MNDVCMSTGHSGSLWMMPVCLEVTWGHYEWCLYVYRSHILILVLRRVIVSLSCTKVTVVVAIVITRCTVREAATTYPTPCSWPWPFDFESGVRVMWDVAYLCANFSLSRPLCSRLRPEVRVRQTSDSIIT